MTQLTKTEQIIAEKTVCILLVRGEDTNGKKIYAYVAIRADKLESFMEAQKQGVFYPEDFGIIIDSGEDEPTDEIKQKMTQEYGFNHEAMLDIASPKKAHDLTSSLSSYAVQVSETEENKNS